MSNWEKATPPLVQLRNRYRKIERQNRQKKEQEFKTMTLGTRNSPPKKLLIKKPIHP